MLDALFDGSHHALMTVRPTGHPWFRWRRCGSWGGLHDRCRGQARLACVNQGLINWGQEFAATYIDEEGSKVTKGCAAYRLLAKQQHFVVASVIDVPCGVQLGHSLRRCVVGQIGQKGTALDKANRSKAGLVGRVPTIHEARAASVRSIRSLATSGQLSGSPGPSTQAETFTVSRKA